MCELGHKAKCTKVDSLYNLLHTLWCTVYVVLKLKFCVHKTAYVTDVEEKHKWE